MGAPQGYSLQRRHLHLPQEKGEGNGLLWGPFKGDDPSHAKFECHSLTIVRDIAIRVQVKHVSSLKTQL